MTTAKFIFVSNDCFLCEKGDFITAQKFRRHLIGHDIYLPGRTLKTRYRNTSTTIYVSYEKKQSRKDIETHHACPSCLEHFVELDALKSHVAVHLPQVTAEEPEDHEEKSSTSKRENQVHETPKKEENTNTYKRLKTISLTYGQSTLDFHPATMKSYNPDKPRLPLETITELSPVVTILADYNTTLPDSLRKIVNQELEDQANLKTLNKYPGALRFLCSALDNSLKDLPKFLWSHPLSNSWSEDEKKLVRMIQFLLTDFSSKCCRSPIFQSKSDLKFLIDQVIPIFQVLESQTDLIGFEWCDVAVDEQSLDNEKDSEEPEEIDSETTPYHDGLGYDTAGNPVLVINNTSREDIDIGPHARDDILKNMHSSIGFLDNTLRNNQFARFATLCRAETFSIQVISKVITLSTTSLNPEEPGAYIHKERRSAEIPGSFSGRMGWIKMFELLATLFDILNFQQNVAKTIAIENSGVDPIDKAETVRESRPFALFLTILYTSYLFPNNSL
ncbi:C2H2-type zinc finger transcription factor [Phycomyces blakesleeanus]|uniref:C2H2-type zinc finger transcription factor n=1 Tax=Phycomyces blakesleeanus TaxID=4837 RepID=A0ABR3ALE0_PHYBL